MDSSILTILKICAYIMFFSVLSKSIPDFSILPFIHSFLEITGGIAQLTETSLSSGLKIALISFFAAFSGLSVFFQVSAVTSGSGLSLKFYFWGKLLQGSLSFAITKITVSRLPKTLDVFAKSAPGTGIAAPQGAFVTSVSMLLFAAFILFLLTFISATYLRRR